MSTTEPARVPLAAALDALPTFDLDYGVDDPREPSAVTIYNPFAEDVTTHWLTVDLAFAVDLADVA